MSSSVYILVVRCIIFILVINFGHWSGSSTTLANPPSVKIEAQKPSMLSKLWNWFRGKPKIVSKNNTAPIIVGSNNITSPSALPTPASVGGKELRSKVDGVAVNPGHNPLELEISVDEAGSKIVSKNNTAPMIAGSNNITSPSALPTPASVGGKELKSKVDGVAVNPGHNPLELKISVDEAGSKVEETAGEVVSKNNTAPVVDHMNNITSPSALPTPASVGDKELKSKVDGVAVKPGHNPLELEVSVDEAPESAGSINTTLMDLDTLKKPVATEEQEVSSTALPTMIPVTTNAPAASLNNTQQQDIIKYTAAVPIITFGYLDLMSSTLSARLDSIKDQSVNAVSSGDEGSIKKGFWVGTTWSGTRQKQNTNIVAFKNKQQGVALGFDGEVGDNMTIGAAYTIGSSKTRFDSTVSDKQRAKLYIAALYTEYNFLSNITLNSYLEYGRAFIKNNDTSTNVNLSGKTKGDIMRAKLEGYYQYNVGTIVLKPIAGIKFDYYTTKSYTASNQDLYVNMPSSKGKRVSVEAGIALGKNIALKKGTINPEVHFGLEKAILASNSSRVISVNDAASQTQVWSTRPSHSSGLRDIIYTVGGSIRVRSSSRYEIKAGYDHSFKKKFSNHSVYLSNKITF